jgi:hypothetical protein
MIHAWMMSHIPRHKDKVVMARQSSDAKTSRGLAAFTAGMEHRLS